MEMAEELKNFHFDLIALQEIRWTGNDKINKKDLWCISQGQRKEQNYTELDF